MAALINREESKTGLFKPHDELDYRFGNLNKHHDPLSRKRIKWKEIPNRANDL